MKSSFKNFAKQKSAQQGGKKMSEQDIKDMISKYDNLSQDELTDLFIDLTAKQKSNGGGGSMSNMIDSLRPMLTPQQQQKLNKLTKNL